MALIGKGKPTLNGTGTILEFVGGTAQTISNTSTGKKETFYNLTVNKSNASNKVTLATGTLIDIAASGSVNISKGDLDLNSNTFALKSGAPIINGQSIQDNTARLLAISSSASITNDINFVMERYVPLVAGQYKARMLGQHHSLFLEVPKQLGFYGPLLQHGNGLMKLIPLCLLIRKKNLQ